MPYIKLCSYKICKKNGFSFYLGTWVDLILRGWFSRRKLVWKVKCQREKQREALGTPGLALAKDSGYLDTWSGQLQRRAVSCRDPPGRIGHDPKPTGTLQVPPGHQNTPTHTPPRPLTLSQHLLTQCLLQRYRCSCSLPCLCSGGLCSDSGSAPLCTTGLRS